MFEAGIAWYELHDLGVGVQVPEGEEFSFLHVVQTGSGAHPSPYPKHIGGTLSGCKAAGA
jgi:hypothetical protein